MSPTETLAPAAFSALKCPNSAARTGAGSTPSNTATTRPGRSVSPRTDKSTRPGTMRGARAPPGPFPLGGYAAGHSHSPPGSRVQLGGTGRGAVPGPGFRGPAARPGPAAGGRLAPAPPLREETVRP